MVTLLDILSPDVAKTRIFPHLTFSDLLSYDEVHPQMSLSLGKADHLEDWDSWDLWVTAGISNCLERNVSVERSALETMTLREVKEVLRELTLLWGPHGIAPLCISTPMQVRCLVSAAKIANRQVANHVSNGGLDAKAVVGDFCFHPTDVEDMLRVDMDDPFIAGQFFFSRDVNFTWDQPEKGTVLSAMIGWMRDARRGFEIEGHEKPLLEHCISTTTNLYSADPRLAASFEMEDMQVEVDFRKGLVEKGPCDLADEANRLIFTTRPGVRCVFSVLCAGPAQPRLGHGCHNAPYSAESTMLTLDPARSSGSFSTLPEGFGLPTMQTFSTVSLPFCPDEAAFDSTDTETTDVEEESENPSTAWH